MTVNLERMARLTTETQQVRTTKQHEGVVMPLGLHATGPYSEPREEGTAGNGDTAGKHYTATCCSANNTWVHMWQLKLGGKPGKQWRQRSYAKEHAVVARKEEISIHGSSEPVLILWWLTSRLRGQRVHAGDHLLIEKRRTAGQQDRVKV